MEKRPVLLIACGALANETIAVMEKSGFDGFTIQCLPAKLHNRPALIPAALRAKIEEEKANFDKIFVLYGDCGTGGDIDKVLAETGTERISGAHCYEFYATTPVFEQITEEEACTYYLTDFLVDHFDRLVIEGLGLDRFPDLLPMYFGNYVRVLYMAQAPTPARIEAAKAAAERLNLKFEMTDTGYGELEKAILRQVPVAAAAPTV
jgi:hypothetical protein